MILTAPPFFQDIDTNAPEFRDALDRAGAILAGTELCVYVCHRHDEVVIQPGEVIFEQRVSAQQLLLEPVAEEEAAELGKPSTWRFAPSEDGAGVSVVVLRYADSALHEQIDVDVASKEFMAQLAEIGRSFVEAGIHEVLELNVLGSLFPPPAGHVTSERALQDRRQTLTFEPTPSAIVDGDWCDAGAACWHFSSTGRPLVTGRCGTGTGLHGS